MENKKEIFAPRYDGSRFKNHTMPLELLEDLKVLQEMTVEMAKALYLEENNDRQRVPKNFTQGISFELEGFQKGSTVPKIIMTFTLTGLFPQANVTCLEQASEKIKDVIQIASEEGDIQAEAPQNVLAYFNRFGKKLREDEHIDFRPEEQVRKARFTRNTRRKLILASSTTGEYTEEVAVRGVLCEMDKNKLTFQIQTTNGKKISGSYDEVLQHQFLEAFSASEGNQKVIVNGIGLFSRDEKLKELKSVEELTLLDAYDLGFRLDELAQLKDGWLNGEGKALSSEGLKWIEKELESKIDTSNIATYAFPTPEGKLQLEWENESTDVELLIDLDSKSASLCVVNHHSDEDVKEKQLNLNNDDDSWASLNAVLTKIFA